MIDIDDPHRLDDGSLEGTIAGQPWEKRRIAALIQINTSPQNAGRTIPASPEVQVTASGFIFAIMAAQVPTERERIGNHGADALKIFSITLICCSE